MHYNGRLSLAIREDSVAGKLYFRFLSPTFIGNNTDTAEHLFFDYNMRLDDTLKMDYTTYHGRHYVGRFDSIQINGLTYHRWRMFPSGSVGGGYTFIEGIGCVAQIDYPVRDHFFEDFLQLRCFSNSAGQPLCTPPTQLPRLNGSINEGIYHVDSFDNVNSCLLKTVGVYNALSQSMNAVVTPNPGGLQSVITLPATQSKILFRVSDIAGCTIQQESVQGGIIPIGQYIRTSGIYYYTLQDASTGQRYTGRFVFQ